MAWAAKTPKNRHSFEGNRHLFQKVPGGLHSRLHARAENHLRGVDDLDDTIRRLRAYVDAGAEVAYAPGLTNPADLRRLVSEVNAPINYLHRPNGPALPELASLGVRRVSTGGALTRVAYAAVEKAIDDLLGSRAAP